DRNADRSSVMNMTLRPGEAVVWRWGHTQPVKYFGTPQHKFTERICNGLWEYRPDFSTDVWRKGADFVHALVSTDSGLAAEADKTGEIVWTIRSPYVIVGGKLDVEGSGARFELSWEGKSWQSVGTNLDQFSLDQFFPPTGTARYAYYLRCQLSGTA